MQIVVIEPDYLQRKHLHTICKKTTGVTCVNSFASIHTAMKYLHQQSADLVILDLDWTPLDSFLLVHQMIDKDSKIAVAFLSSEKKYCYEAIQVDAAGYLLKPYLDTDINALIEKVQRHTHAAMK